MTCHTSAATAHASTPLQTVQSSPATFLSSRQLMPTPNSKSVKDSLFETVHLVCQDYPVSMKSFGDKTHKNFDQDSNKFGCLYIKNSKANSDKCTDTCGKIYGFRVVSLAPPSITSTQDSVCHPPPKFLSVMNLADCCIAPRTTTPITLIASTPFLSSLSLTFTPGHLVSSVLPPAFWTLTRLYGLSLCFALWIMFAADRPTPVSQTTLVPRPNISVCCCSDPACSTMSLSRPGNKSLQMNPLTSRLSLSVTEYSVTTGSSSFSGELSTANHSDLPDYILIEVFCDSLNEPLKSKLRRGGPRSSLAAFMDYALLTVGSLFTVGVAEEECDIATMPVMAAATLSQPGTPGHSCLMIATPVLKPIHVMVATAKPVHKMEAAPECAHVMPVTAEPVYKMAAKILQLCFESSQVSESSQVAAVFPESSKVTAATPESSKITAAVPVSSQVTAAVPVLSQGKAVFPVSRQSSKVKAAVPESSKVKAAVPESSKVKAAVPEPSTVKTVVLVSSKVRTDFPESSQATSDLHEPGQATADHREPSQATADHREPSHATAGLHEPGQVTADLHEPSQVTVDLHEPSQVIAVVPESSHVPSDGPESSHVPSDGPESSHVPSDSPEPRHVSSDTPRSRPIMMASVLDSPLVSVWTANIPVASAPSKPTIKEVLPPAAALPLMAVAIWCVWAAHCAPEVPSVHKSASEVSSGHKSAPELSSVLKSAPEVSSGHKSASEVSSGHKSAPELSSVLKSAPEVSSDHKSASEVLSDHKSAPEISSVLKSAPEVTSDHKSAPEVSSDHKSALEVSSDHESAPEASSFGEAAPMPPEVSAPAVEPPMEAAFPYELSASLPILSASSVPALPRSQSMTQAPAPPWWAPAPPAPPWRAPAPPALPWRAPAPPALPWRVPAPPALPPAPPWWAPALPVMPQSPGPPHGPSPPTLALSCSRPTTPLDCCSMWFLPCHITQTVALHPGLLLPSPITLIASTPVTNQAHYKSPGLSLRVHRFLSSLSLTFTPGHLVLSVSPPAFWTLARLYGLSLCFALWIMFAADRPTPISQTTLVPRPNISVCCCSDPACSTMPLSHPGNKSLQMNPLASRLSLSVTLSMPSSFIYGAWTSLRGGDILFNVSPRLQHVPEAAYRNSIPVLR
ncbi:Adhesive plaque matrix protein [Labeo rohita]|uniref:Adhesive plaque matrix protein n=1 Tax=Labeo rohita TaxID=84645 RepID=A0ABQ8LJZ8_LABRO|nr:Adhesive plaque matrix protein [Labeo rohita]